MAHDDSRITDLQALKVFTHPLRIRLYRALFVAGSATASQLAEEADEAVSLVSYHLRKMAEHGFIEEASDQSTDGRERWWRPVGEEGWSFRSSDFDHDPAGAAVVGDVSRHLLDERRQTYERFLRQRSAWSDEWTDAAFGADIPASLTAAELQEMYEELYAVTRRWNEHGKAAVEAGDTEGREEVAVHMYGFPVVRP